jgi:TPR repeat protein
MFNFFRKIKTTLSAVIDDGKPKVKEGLDATEQFNLGVFYENGLEVTHDYKEALKWFSLSAEQGCADAQNNLGVMFEQGLGVPQNYVLAIHLSLIHI